jgi:hypothetical protein
MWAKGDNSTAYRIIELMYDELRLNTVSLDKVKNLTSISSVNEWKGTRAGKRPTNSGIIPNSMRSWASTSDRYLRARRM